jgi:2-oxoglutarate dehydrogenase E1 component
MNLEASRKKDLTIITPFMKMNGCFEQVTDVQMLQKVDTSYQQGLTQVADAVCNLPTDKSSSTKANQR